MITGNIVDDRVLPKGTVVTYAIENRFSMKRFVLWKDYGDDDPNLFQDLIKRVEDEARNAGLIAKIPEQLQLEAERHYTWVK
jgi:hypothetical protein